MVFKYNTRCEMCESEYDKTINKTDLTIGLLYTSERYKCFRVVTFAK